ncbi:hypothetical protein [Mycobacterium sp. NPDC050853]|uniref:hypothetical protein n=1 Tax=Mycobacterium sp. NPDC050853 TaxID=3155160 RepID=UPI0033F8C992
MRSEFHARSVLGFSIALPYCIPDARILAALDQPGSPTHGFIPSLTATPGTSEGQA